MGHGKGGSSNWYLACMVCTFWRKHFKMGRVKSEIHNDMTIHVPCLATRSTLSFTGLVWVGLNFPQNGNCANVHTFAVFVQRAWVMRWINSVTIFVITIFGTTISWPSLLFIDLLWESYFNFNLLLYQFQQFSLSMISPRLFSCFVGTLVIVKLKLSTCTFYRHVSEWDTGRKRENNVLYWKGRDVYTSIYTVERRWTQPKI